MTFGPTEDKILFPQKKSIMIQFIRTFIIFLRSSLNGTSNMILFIFTIKNTNEKNVSWILTASSPSGPTKNKHTLLYERTSSKIINSSDFKLTKKSHNNWRQSGEDDSRWLTLRWTEEVEEGFGVHNLGDRPLCALTFMMLDLLYLLRRHILAELPVDGTTERLVFIIKSLIYHKHTSSIVNT